MRSPWLIVADGEVGQHEIKGGENHRILEYHASTTLKAKEDEIPWCSSFVNWCMEQAGVKGTGSAAAKSWLGWGTPLTSPIEGCVCVIKQKIIGVNKATGSVSGYHVAFWLKEEGGRVFLLGGNQGDSVKISSFGLNVYTIEGYRFPGGAT